MTTFDMETRLDLFGAAMRSASVIHAVAPGDFAALADAARVARALAPSYQESAAFSAQHGLPAPDAELHAATIAKLDALAALAFVAPTEH